MMYGLDLVTQPSIQWELVAAMTLGGASAVGYAMWHMKRTSHPLVPLPVFGVPTFRASILGGSMSRIAISSAPFLFPLMFQLALGFTMLQSGFLMLAVFAGNLGMKAGTTYVLQRFGFRTTLLINGVLVALGFVACAAFTADTSIGWMAAVLLFGGMCRSMQFTAIGTLAFCDTSPTQTSGASTLFSMFQQLSAGLGVAFGAIALRLSELQTGHAGNPGLVDFQIALLMMAALVCLSLIDAFRLPGDAGAGVSNHRKSTTNPS